MIRLGVDLCKSLSDDDLSVVGHVPAERGLVAGEAKRFFKNGKKQRFFRVGGPLASDLRYHPRLPAFPSKRIESPPATR